MIRRLSDIDLFRIGPSGLEEISDATLELRLDALERAAVTDPAGTLPDCPLSQVAPLRSV